MLQQTVELVKSDAVVEIDPRGVKVYDNVPWYVPVRQVIELEDAITLAKAILSFVEDNAEELAEMAEDETRYLARRSA